MPIRTNRGRTAVYRRIWGWPLRSPKHLAGVAAVLTVLVVGIGLLVPRLLGDGGQAGWSPAADDSAGQDGGASLNLPESTGSGLPTRLDSPLRTPTSAPPNEQALRTAKSWAQMWVRHPDGMTNKQWLDKLRPYTTEEYLPQMSTVDLANIPASRVTGEPEPVSSYTSSVEADVPTDGPVLRITVIKTDNGWRVSDYAQRR